MCYSFGKFIPITFKNKTSNFLTFHSFLLLFLQTFNSCSGKDRLCWQRWCAAGSAAPCQDVSLDMIDTSPANCRPVTPNIFYTISSTEHIHNSLHNNVNTVNRIYDHRTLVDTYCINHHFYAINYKKLLLTYVMFYLSCVGQQGSG